MKKRRILQSLIAMLMAVIMVVPSNVAYATTSGEKDASATESNDVDIPSESSSGKNKGGKATAVEPSTWWGTKISVTYAGQNLFQNDVENDEDGYKITAKAAGSSILKYRRGAALYTEKSAIGLVNSESCGVPYYILKYKGKSYNNNLNADDDYLKYIGCFGIGSTYFIYDVGDEVRQEIGIKSNNNSKEFTYDEYKLSEKALVTNVTKVKEAVESAYKDWKSKYREDAAGVDIDKFYTGTKGKDVSLADGIYYAFSYGNGSVKDDYNLAYGNKLADKTGVKMSKLMVKLPANKDSKEYRKKSAKNALVTMALLKLMVRSSKNQDVVDTLNTWYTQFKNRTANFELSFITEPIMVLHNSTGGDIGMITPNSYLAGLLRYNKELKDFPTKCKDSSYYINKFAGKKKYGEHYFAVPKKATTSKGKKIPQSLIAKINSNWHKLGGNFSKITGIMVTKNQIKSGSIYAKTISNFLNQKDKLKYAGDEAYKPTINNKKSKDGYYLASIWNAKYSEKDSNNSSIKSPIKSSNNAIIGSMHYNGYITLKDTTTTIKALSGYDEGYKQACFNKLGFGIYNTSEFVESSTVNIESAKTELTTSTISILGNNNKTMTTEYLGNTSSINFPGLEVSEKVSKAIRQVNTALANYQINDESDDSGDITLKVLEAMANGDDASTECIDEYLNLQSSNDDDDEDEGVTDYNDYDTGEEDTDTDDGVSVEIKLDDNFENGGYVSLVAKCYILANYYDKYKDVAEIIVPEGVDKDKYIGELLNAFTMGNMNNGNKTEQVLTIYKLLNSLEKDTTKVLSSESKIIEKDNLDYKNGGSTLDNGVGYASDKFLSLSLRSDELLLPENSKYKYTGKTNLLDSKVRLNNFKVENVGNSVEHTFTSYVHKGYEYFEKCINNPDSDLSKDNKAGSVLLKSGKQKNVDTKVIRSFRANRESSVVWNQQEEKQFTQGVINTIIGIGDTHFVDRMATRTTGDMLGFESYRVNKKKKDDETDLSKLESDSGYSVLTQASYIIDWNSIGRILSNNSGISFKNLEDDELTTFAKGGLSAELNEIQALLADYISDCQEYASWYFSDKNTLKEVKNDENFKIRCNKELLIRLQNYLDITYDSRDVPKYTVLSSQISDSLETTDNVQQGIIDNKSVLRTMQSVEDRSSNIKYSEFSGDNQHNLKVGSDWLNYDWLTGVVSGIRNGAAWGEPLKGEAQLTLGIKGSEQQDGEHYSSTDLSDGGNNKVFSSDGIDDEKPSRLSELFGSTKYYLKAASMGEGKEKSDVRRVINSYSIVQYDFNSSNFNEFGDSKQCYPICANYPDTRGVSGDNRVSNMIGNSSGKTSQITDWSNKHYLLSCNEGRLEVSGSTGYIPTFNMVLENDVKTNSVIKYIPSVLLAHLASANNKQGWADYLANLEKTNSDVTKNLNSAWVYLEKIIENSVNNGIVSVYNSDGYSVNGNRSISIETDKIGDLLTNVITLSTLTKTCSYVMIKSPATNNQTSTVAFAPAGIGYIVKPKIADKKVDDSSYISLGSEKTKTSASDSIEALNICQLTSSILDSDSDTGVSDLWEYKSSTLTSMQSFKCSSVWNTSMFVPSIAIDAVTIELPEGFEEKSSSGPNSAEINPDEFYEYVSSALADKSGDKVRVVKNAYMMPVGITKAFKWNGAFTDYSLCAMSILPHNDSEGGVLNEKGVKVSNADLNNMYRAFKQATSSNNKVNVNYTLKNGDTSYEAKSLLVDYSHFDSKERDGYKNGWLPAKRWFLPASVSYYEAKQNCNPTIIVFVRKKRPSSKIIVIKDESGSIIKKYKGDLEVTEDSSYKFKTTVGNEEELSKKDVTEILTGKDYSSLSDEQKKQMSKLYKRVGMKYDCSFVVNSNHKDGGMSRDKWAESLASGNKAYKKDLSDLTTKNIADVVKSEDENIVHGSTETEIEMLYGSTVVEVYELAIPGDLKIWDDEVTRMHEKFMELKWKKLEVDLLPKSFTMNLNRLAANDVSNPPYNGEDLISRPNIGAGETVSTIGLKACNQGCNLNGGNHIHDFDYTLPGSSWTSTFKTGSHSLGNYNWTVRADMDNAKTNNRASVFNLEARADNKDGLNDKYGTDSVAENYFTKSISVKTNEHKINKKETDTGIIYNGFMGKYYQVIASRTAQDVVNAANYKYSTTSRNYVLPARATSGTDSTLKLVKSNTRTEKVTESSDITTKMDIKQKAGGQSSAHKLSIDVANGYDQNIDYSFSTINKGLGIPYQLKNECKNSGMTSHNCHDWVTSRGGVEISREHMYCAIQRRKCEISYRTNTFGKIGSKYGFAKNWGSNSLYGGYNYPKNSTKYYPIFDTNYYDLAKKSYLAGITKNASYWGTLGIAKLEDADSTKVWHKLDTEEDKLSEDILLRVQVYQTENTELLKSNNMQGVSDTTDTTPSSFTTFGGSRLNRSSTVFKNVTNTKMKYKNDISFHPYVRMQSSNNKGESEKYLAILGDYARNLPRYDTVEIGWNDTSLKDSSITPDSNSLGYDGSHNIQITSKQWSTHSRAISAFSKENESGKNKILPGGAVYSLSTGKLNKSGANGALSVDNGDQSIKVALRTYNYFIPNELYTQVDGDPEYKSGDNKIAGLSHYSLNATLNAIQDVSGITNDEKNSLKIGSAVKSSKELINGVVRGLSSMNIEQIVVEGKLDENTLLNLASNKDSYNSLCSNDGVSLSNNGLSVTAKRILKGDTLYTRTLSKQNKYWLRPMTDNERTDNTLERDKSGNSGLDVTSMDTMRYVFTVRSDVRGNVIIEKYEYISGSECRYIACIKIPKTVGIQAFRGCLQSDRNSQDILNSINFHSETTNSYGVSTNKQTLIREIFDIDNSCQLVTNYMATIERNTGSGHAVGKDNNDKGKIKGYTGGWYNEAFDGISVLVTESVMDLGFYNGKNGDEVNNAGLQGGARSTATRSLAMNVKLTGKLENKNDLYNFGASLTDEQQIAELRKEKMRTTMWITKPKAYNSLEYGYVTTIGSASSNAVVKYDNYKYIEAGDSGFTPIGLMDMYKMYTSRAFYIPNTTVMDLN